MKRKVSLAMWVCSRTALPLRAETDPPQPGAKGVLQGRWCETKQYLTGQNKKLWMPRSHWRDEQSMDQTPTLVLLQQAGRILLTHWVFLRWGSAHLTLDLWK